MKYFLRLEYYLINRHGEEANNVLDRYHNNMALSEAMFPTLHYLEICLRNRIDNILKEYFSPRGITESSNKLQLSEQDIKKIEDIKSKIKRENKREPIHDDIVAQMTFGFWCSLFHRRLDPIIWQHKQALKMVFPNIARINRKRSYIEPKLLIIKGIRNRIAHHEPVWNTKATIIDAHEVCHELIQAMSLEAYNLLKKNR